MTTIKPFMMPDAINCDCGNKDAITGEFKKKSKGSKFFMTICPICKKNHGICGVELTKAG